MAFHHNPQLLDPSPGSCHRNARLLDPVPGPRAVQYKTPLKRIIGRVGNVGNRCLGDLCEVGSELLFFDKEELIFVRLD